MSMENIKELSKSRPVCRASMAFHSMLRSLYVASMAVIAASEKSIFVR